MRKARASYTAATRAQAVALVTTQGVTLAAAAVRLGIPRGTLANWVAAARGAMASGNAVGGRTVQELELENARLRKALAQARQERVRLLNCPPAPCKPL